MLFIFILTGIGLITLGFYCLYILRLIENTPTSKVRSLALGIVEVFGKALIENEFIGPFSGKKCVWCKWSVQEYKSNGKSGNWYTIKSEKFEKPFYLEDETGKVLINPIRANIDIPPKIQCGLGQLSEKSKTFLENNGVKIKSFLGFHKRMRFIEESIFSNEKIYIFGTAKSSDVKDFIKNEDGIVIEKGKAPFFISNKEEGEIRKSYKIFSIICFITGAIFLLIGIFFILGTGRI